MGSAASTHKKGKRKAEKYSTTIDNDEISRISQWDRIFDGSSTKSHQGTSKMYKELKYTLSQGSDSEMVKAVERLMLLSSCKENLRSLGSSELGLMPHLVANISKCIGCVTVIANIAMDPQNHTYLLSNEVSVMYYIITKIRDNEKSKIRDDFDAIWILTNMSECLKSESIESFLSYGPLSVVVKRLKSACFEQLIDGMDVWIVSFLEAISYHSMAAAKLKELDALPRLMELMVHPSNTGVKASIAVFNILGAEECVDKPALMHLQKPIFERLLAVFKATLAQDGEEELVDQCRECIEDYYFGAVKMRSLCSAVRALSVSERNKPLLLEAGVLGLMIQALKLFASDAPSLETDSQKAGGGGDDTESAELIIETLLQLSFSFKTDAVLVEAYVWACEHCIADILSYCSGDMCKLSSYAKSSARYLLSRLVPPEPSVHCVWSSVKSSADVSNDLKGHIVLSYSQRDAKLELIQAVASKLSALGHEVFQAAEECDAEIENLHEMTMTAIESAHTVIVFVSPEYKESGLCRVTAEAIQHRELVCPSMKVLYVMTCSGYFTSTGDCSVDGWLGSMLGRSLWYPLWTLSAVNTTANCLHDCMTLTCPAPSLAASCSTASVSSSSLSVVSPRVASLLPSSSCSVVLPVNLLA